MPRSPARSANRRRPLLSHKRLLIAETVLVLGLVQMFARDWVLAQVHLPAPVRVAFGMALILGLFGSLLFFLQKQIKRSLDTTHNVVQRLPLPTPMLLVHTLAFLVLFWCYATYWHLEGQVWQAVLDGVAQVGVWWSTRQG